VAVPGTVEGADRSAWLRGKEPESDRAVLIESITPFGEWTRHQGGREYRGLRTTRYTYARSLDGPWLLYDNRKTRTSSESDRRRQVCRDPGRPRFPAERGVETPQGRVFGPVKNT